MAMRHTSFFFSSRIDAISTADFPISTRRRAYSARIPLPIAAELPSTTWTFGYSAAAISALWQVPDNLEEIVRTTALSSGPKTSSNTFINADGEAWLVVGRMSLSTSFS